MLVMVSKQESNQVKIHVMHSLFVPLVNMFLLLAVSLYITEQTANKYMFDQTKEMKQTLLSHLV